MAFNHRDFASDIPIPEKHHTDQSVYCFYDDPFIYYRTYVQKLLESPPFITSPAELVYKYELLMGSTAFGQRFRTDAPINPKTDKPYGEETQKYAEWAHAVQVGGLIPMHPSNVEAARKLYVQTIDQFELGLVPRLEKLLEAKGESSFQVTSVVDSSNCYAHIDHLSEEGDLFKVALVPSLDRFYNLNDPFNTPRANELAFKIAYQYLILRNMEESVKLKDAFAVVAEYSPPYRTVVVPINLTRWLLTVESTVQRLNQSFNSTSIDVWLSKYSCPRCSCREFSI